MREDANSATLAVPVNKSMSPHETELTRTVQSFGRAGDCAGVL